jgi:hypothetical protein
MPDDRDVQHDCYRTGDPVASRVVIARIDVAIDTPVPSEGFVCRSQVTAGYKIAAGPISKGEPVRKYNVVIGFAATATAPGTMVHSHNIVGLGCERNQLARLMDREDPTADLKAGRQFSLLMNDTVWYCTILEMGECRE